MPCGMRKLLPLLPETNDTQECMVCVTLVVLSNFNVTTPTGTMEVLCALHVVGRVRKPRKSLEIN